jgi:S-adenosylmethionine:tRNA ribosyltransferase-isomerase
VKKSDFHYDLPPELIAQAPLPNRSASRLLVVPPVPQALQDAHFSDLTSCLRPGDLLIFNDTRVIPARLFGRKPTGGHVEILVERVLDEHTALAQIGASKTPKIGGLIELNAGGLATVIAREEGFFTLQFEIDTDLTTYLETVGQLPLPPYIERDPQADDSERYQTVYARHTGAVAAPTAGLHFDDALLSTLQSQGIEFGYVTLHVGAGTFQPVRVEDLSQHVMHRERVEVSDELAERIAAVRAAGGRIIAVGTTVVRALESATRRDADGNPVIGAFNGESQLFIVPGYRITAVDAMVTNFHLPESTLLMMISAFAGFDRVIEAYRHAIAQRYRFFSYGDAMLLFPAMPSAPSQEITA